MFKFLALFNIVLYVLIFLIELDKGFLNASGWLCASLMSFCWLMSQLELERYEK